MNAPISTADRIRELNDAFRTTGPSAGDRMLTYGVRAYGPDSSTSPSTPFGTK